MTAAGDPRVAPPIVPPEHYRLLVESVRDYAIFMLDPEGRVATWNAGAQSIKGYAPHEIIGKHISTFYTPHDRADGRPQRLLLTAMAEGRVEDEGWRVRSDGTPFWADVVITALRDAAGQLVGFAKVTRDLSERRAAEEKLRNTEELLAATLYSIGDGVLVTDERGRLTIINRIAEQLTGWTERDAIGRSVDEVFHIVNEHTRERAPNPIERVLREGVVVGLANHTALISADGSERPIADSGAPIRDGQGRLRGAVLVFRDVADERRTAEVLGQSEERLRLMIASVSEYAIVLLDANGRVATWNTGAERIKGYKADEIIGRPFSLFFTAEQIRAGEPARELERAATVGRFEDETWRVRKDGSRFWANVVLSAVRDTSGELIGFTKVTRDLTERRKTEDERVRLAQAQEAVRLRDEFLSIASHELKTPLTALQLQLQGVLDRVAGDPALARKVERATRAGTRLSDLIETLFDVSRIATGRLELRLERCALFEVAREVLERMRDPAHHAGCELSLEAQAAVVGTWDRLRIEQVVTQLLANAIKYAPGRPITVRVRGEAAVAVLEVRDRGPGLQLEAIGRIFDRFERATSPAAGGMGVGLYVARQIAHAHGGSIDATNLPDGGACFTVRLPLAPAAR